MKEVSGQSCRDIDVVAFSCSRWTYPMGGFHYCSDNFDQEESDLNIGYVEDRNNFYIITE
jgi:hypothetical protein